MAPLILKLGARRGRSLYPPEMNPGTHCTGGWVGSRGGLDVLQKKTRWNVGPGPPKHHKEHNFATDDKQRLQNRTKK
jgi:hypothetical protein